jgi:peptidoglycan/xylan/chitin deacetylase (PgdA/CDA1 family)
MIASIKRSSFALSKRLGLSRLVARSAWRRQRLLILCYHGIALDDEHRWHDTLFVSAAHFQRHLALLRHNGCAVLPLGDALQRLYARELPERAVVLTFDDGYYDFQARAWPLLQQSGYPATVYLTTARVEHNFPIVNLFVSYMLWLARERQLDGRGIVGLEGRHSLQTRESRDRLVARMDRAIQARGMTATQKDTVAATIARCLDLDYEALLASRVLTLLRRDEVAALSAQGLDVQLHTHLHRTPEDATLFVDDVLRNRDIIEQTTGRRPTHLCYPSGMYRMAYLPALRREGLASATTCDPGIAACAVDPLLLPRFMDTSAITDVEFEAWVSGVASCLPRRTTRAHPPTHERAFHSSSARGTKGTSIS